MSRRQPQKTTNVIRGAREQGKSLLISIPIPLPPCPLKKSPDGRSWRAKRTCDLAPWLLPANLLSPRRKGRSNAGGGAGRRHRRRRGRLLGALSPGEGRLARRHADRARRADQRLVLACRGRLPHPERRSERRQAPGLHRRALPRAGGAVGTVLRAAPDRRRHARRQPRAHGLPAAHPRQGPLPRDGNRDHQPGRGAGDVPAARPEPLRRRALGPGRGAPRPVGHHPRLRQGGAKARCDHRAAQPRGRADPGPGRHLERRHRARHASAPSTWSTPAGSGRARSGAWSGSSCRSWPWSTCTS